MNDPKKPLQLRKDTWEWALSHGMLENIERADLGSVLYELGIINQPELLRDTVIELDGEVEYVIPIETANIIGSAKPTSQKVTLIRLFDHEEHLVPISVIHQAIQKGPLFDQLTIKD